MTSDPSRHRLGLIAVLALSLFGALFARLWVLQVVEGESFQLRAEGNATETVIVEAPRGRILDRNGIPLVENRESIVVGIDAQEFGELSEGKQEAVLERLAFNLNVGRPESEQLTVDDIRRELNDDRYSRLAPIPIAEDLTTEDEIYFSEQADLYPAVTVQRTTVRSYPYGSLAAHVLGYVGALSDEQWEELKEDNDPDKPYQQTDKIGKAGVEASYESYLRGTPGQRRYEVDRSGNVVREIEADRVEPRAGDDVYLSIDVRVQYKTEEALQARLATAYEGYDGGEAGGMVVLDQSTGQVRAMASYPTYNPADLVGGISCPVWRDLQGLPAEGECKKEAMDAEIKAMKEAETPPVPKLINRSMQGSYPPASTFKLATSYAAMKLGLRTPEDTIVDNGFIELCGANTETTGCVKQNADRTPHGSVALAKSLTVSSDVYYYTLGRDAWAKREEIGDDALQQAMKDLGYGKRTGIDLPAESGGMLPTPATELETALSLFEKDPAYYDNSEEKAREYGRWNTGLSADLAIGQKANATPLQTANAYASLANGGDLLVPTVLHKITASFDEATVHEEAKREVIRRIEWGDAIDDYIHGFQGVVDQTNQVDRGTAVSPFEGFPFGSMKLAGKTGTAQTGEDKNKNERPDNSLFVAFSIGGQTNWTASAMLEFSGSGSGAAAPAVRMVLEPIATGEIYGFTVPRGGTIDADQAAEASSGIGTTGSD